MSKDKVADVELHPLFIVIQGGIRAYTAADELWMFDFFFWNIMYWTGVTVSSWAVQTEESPSVLRSKSFWAN